MLIAFCQLSLPSSWEKALSGFTPLCESHGATHPAGERWKPGSADSEDQDEPAGPGPAAQSLDGVELDERTRHPSGEAGGVASRERSGRDPGILISRFPAIVHTPHSRGRVWDGVRRIFMPLVVAPRAKFGPHVQAFSRLRYFGACPYGVASRTWCAAQRSVGERVTFTCVTLRDLSSMRKKAKSGRKKRSVTCKKSPAHTSAA